MFGQGVLLAFMLTLILTGVNYMTVAKEVRKDKGAIAFPHPFWPWGAKLAVRNGLRHSAPPWLLPSCGSDSSEPSWFRRFSPR